MANQYLRPQIPIQNKDDDYIYPITLAEQVVTNVSTNERLSNVLDIKPLTNGTHLLARSTIGLSSSTTSTAIRKTYTLTDDISNYTVIIVKGLYTDGALNCSTALHFPKVNLDGDEVSMLHFSSDSTSFHLRIGYKIHDNTLDIYMVNFAGFSSPAIEVIGIN